ncbi:MAG TPA: phosphopantetheinyl transferase [Verrucomicrobiales bacterium]|nr:phosphopantetheinyl transferase [Verrucomicrobiales bacterium]
MSDLPASPAQSPPFPDCWEALGTPPPLGREEVHVWLTPLDPDRDRLARCEAVLSPEEVARAGRFRFERHRHAFILSRGTLRLLLSDYTGHPAREIAFSLNPFGKPSLATPRHPLRFNLSHSHGLALHALTLTGELGVDIEQVRPDVMGEKIADRYFAPPEIESLHSLPPELQAEGFFSCWSRKEAYIKARGDGLSRSLDTFAVSLKPTEPAELLWSGNDPSARETWRLWNLPAPAGYKAALVTLRTVRTVRHLQLLGTQAPG